MRKYKSLSLFLACLIIFTTLFSGCNLIPTNNVISLADIPEFNNDPYVTINGNVPYFEDNEITDKSFESYSELDIFGRCGVAFACIGKDIMPTEDRGSIGQVKPSGWQLTKYDIVDGKYLYNRCHLIGFQLAGENANNKNLITGTRYMNVNGMLPFENMVADYVKETLNHVMYRVTPIFQDNELVARGVLMEAWSVEDDGDGICFNVYVYNNQPGVIINYSDGTSRLAGTSEATEAPSAPTSTPDSDETEITYILNTNTMKFHLESCPSVSSIKEENKQYFTGSRDTLIADGYSPCKSCNP